MARTGPDLNGHRGFPPALFSDASNVVTAIAGAEGFLLDIGQISHQDLGAGYRFVAQSVEDNSADGRPLGKCDGELGPVRPDFALLIGSVVFVTGDDSVFPIFEGIKDELPIVIRKDTVIKELGWPAWTGSL